MKVVNKKIMVSVIALLVVIEVCTLFLMYKSLGNKETKLDSVNLKENRSDMIAILLEQDDGTYEESATWPNEGYQYDAIKSGCMDEDGNKLEGVLSYDESTNIATVETGNTSYCYLYFYKVANIESQTFNYTGSYQEYTASASGYYYIETYGASGGSMGSYTGGNGGYSSGYIYLEKNDKLYIYVGGQGVAGAGGYNGGAADSNSGVYGTSGGGATDVRYFGSVTPSTSDLAWNSSLGLNSRIIVAGGGAGANQRGDGYGEGNGGVGGTLIGGTGTSTNNGNTYGYAIGTGGTQNSGGKMYWTEKGSGERVTGYYNASSFGASNANQSTGGGGYYGGGSAGHGGSGGGSSFMSGYAGSNAITSSSDTSNPRTHSNNTIHYSGKYFLKGNMQVGINSGNGKAVISYYGRTFEKTNTKLDNVRYIKDCINGNTINSDNHWVELQAIKDGKNIAKGKNVTGDEGKHLSNITDGDIYLTPEKAHITTKEVYSTQLRYNFNVSDITAGDVLHFKFIVSGNATKMTFNDIEFTTYSVVNSGNSYTVTGYVEVTNEMITDRAYSYSTMRFIDIYGSSLSTVGIYPLLKNSVHYTAFSGEKCIIVDLDSAYNLDEIAVWHYYEDGRSYNNHSLYVSSDNSTWENIIDNKSGVVETSNGIRVQNR